MNAGRRRSIRQACALNPELAYSSCALLFLSAACAANDVFAIWLGGGLALWCALCLARLGFRRRMDALTTDGEQSAETVARRVEWATFSVWRRAHPGAMALPGAVIFGSGVMFGESWPVRLLALAGMLAVTVRYGTRVWHGQT